MTQMQDLASLVSSRISHDLVSPLGAIGNGLELMMLAGAEETPEMSLVNDSLAGAAARIWFFRLAFGAAETGAVARAGDIEKAVQAIGGRKTEVIWEPQGDQLRTDVKLALLAANCLETTQPYGGTIRISARSGRWQVCAEAERLNMIEIAWAHLLRPEDAKPLPAGLVQFALLPPEADRQGCRIDVVDQPPRLSIRF